MLNFEKKSAKSTDNTANWSKEKLNAELEKGYADMLAGRTKPVASFFSELKKKIKGKSR